MAMTWVLLQEHLAEAPTTRAEDCALNPTLSEALTRGVGCGKSARPDLWGERMRWRPPWRLRTPEALGAPHSLLPDDFDRRRQPRPSRSNFVVAA